MVNSQLKAIMKELAVEEKPYALSSQGPSFVIKIFSFLSGEIR
jgi:hypothetical protein